MDEVEIVTLENNQDFLIIDEIQVDDIKYVYLSNVNDEKDLCVRKVIKKDGKDIITKLSSDEELDKALLIFAKNHHGDKIE